MRFLVVDDSAMMRRMLVKALNEVGHQDIRQAGNGQEGLAALAEGPVDMILTDWNMPQMSGVEFVRALRAIAATSKTPVLMVTTKVSPDDQAEAKQAGVNDFVGKPFTGEKLQDTIDRVLRG